MAVQCKVITAQKPTGVGTQTQTHTIGFDAKGFIAFGTDNNTAVNTFAPHNIVTMGFCDLTNHYGMCAYDEDNVGTGDTMHYVDNAHALIFLNALASGTPSESGRMKYLSKTSTQLTVQFDNNTARASWYCLIVFGGDDITNVKVGNKTIPANQAASTQLSYNDIGVTAGKVAFFLSSNAASATEETLDDQSALTFGAAVSAAKQFLTHFHIEGNQAVSDTRKRSSGASVLYSLNDTGSSNLKADFNSFISGGFVLYVSTANDTSAKNFGYMVIEGGTWDAGEFTTSGSTGVQPHAISLSGQTPKGLIVATYGNAASSSILQEAHFSIGATDGTSHGYLGSHSLHNQSTMITAEIHGTDRVLRRITAVATEASSTSQLLASHSSFGSDVFNLNYATAAAYMAGFIAVADNVVTGPTETTVTSKTVTNKFITHYP